MSIPRTSALRSTIGSASSLRPRLGALVGADGGVHDGGIQAHVIAPGIGRSMESPMDASVVESNIYPRFALAVPSGGLHDGLGAARRPGNSEVSCSSIERPPVPSKPRPEGVDRHRPVKCGEFRVVRRSPWVRRRGLCAGRSPPPRKHHVRSCDHVRGTPGARALGWGVAVYADQQGVVGGHGAVDDAQGEPCAHPPGWKCRDPSTTEPRFHPVSGLPDATGGVGDRLGLRSCHRLKLSRLGLSALNNGRRHSHTQS